MQTEIKKRIQLLSLLLITGAAGCVSSLDSSIKSRPPQSLNYYYDQLRIKDYNEMHQIILFYLRLATGEITSRRYQKTPPNQLISKALLTSFLRPDTDDVLFRLKPLLKAKANQFGDFNRQMTKLTRKALRGIRNTSWNKRERASYYFVLKNIVSHCLKEKSPENKKNLDLIYKAQIKMPADLETHLHIEALESEVHSPSKTAEKALKSL